MHRVSVRYPGLPTMAKCDHIITTDGPVDHDECGIEVKRLRFLGDNGKRDDCAMTKTLSRSKRNRARDRDTDRRLQDVGLAGDRVWEHETIGCAAKRVGAALCSSMLCLRAGCRLPSNIRSRQRGCLAKRAADPVRDRPHIALLISTPSEHNVTASPSSQSDARRKAYFRATIFAVSHS